MKYPLNPVQNWLAWLAISAAALKPKPVEPPAKKKTFKDGGPCKGLRMQL